MVLVTEPSQQASQAHPSIANRYSKLEAYARFIKLEHTVFSLPVIFAGTLLGARGLPTVRLAVLILLAAIGGRVMAMGLNRIIDVAIDVRNPRTKNRELPRKAMRLREAWVIVIVAGLLYAGSAAAIAPICLKLSPVPITLFVVYPYLKRFTAFAHLGLGLAWSAAPLGGWLAATRSLVGLGETWSLWLFSVLWVTGFDIIYATMDEAFDREMGLHSLPVALGKKRALLVAATLHAIAFCSLIALWQTQLHDLACLWWLAAVGALFIWQHRLANTRPEFAFFTLNGILGFLVLGLAWSAM